MLTYIARRILLAGLTMALMSVLTFVVMQLPEGDYVDEMLRAAQLGAGDDARHIEDRLREFYGLDKPALVQYWKWISRIVTKFQFGHSFGAAQLTSSPGTYTRQEPIVEVIREPIKLTIALTTFTIVVTWVMGIPIGIYSGPAAHHRGLRVHLHRVLGPCGTGFPSRSGVDVRVFRLLRYERRGTLHKSF